MPLRILLVDDHPLVRAGMRNLLDVEPGFEVCGEAGNGKEAVEQVLGLHPDIVLMDISMPVMNGIQATQQIRQLAPNVKIIMVSLHDSPQFVTQATEAGAARFFTKSRGFQELQRTILEVVS